MNGQSTAMPLPCKPQGHTLKCQVARQLLGPSPPDSGTLRSGPALVFRFHRHLVELIFVWKLPQQANPFLFLPSPFFSVIAVATNAGLERDHRSYAGLSLLLEGGNAVISRLASIFQ